MTRINPQRLFHCVSERDEFGWPKLTTKAMDIELRAACVPETTRDTIIKELDPQNVGEVNLILDRFLLFADNFDIINPYS